VELDASFNNAFPIIKEKIPEVYHDACYTVLRAAAFTYVIGVFKNIISLRFMWSVLKRIR
jgi:Zn-dependent membrane protease YugP